MAKEACLSPFHFARAFKVATGTAPHQYVTNRRIGRAKALIAEGEFPLAVIADKCGFSSQAHFTRWFKQFVGTTPGEYCSNYGIGTSSHWEKGLDCKTISLTTERHGDVLSINVRGQIDDAATSVFEEAVQNAIEETDRAVILDLGDLTFIGNWGLQTILQIKRDLQNQDAELVLCGLSARVREKFGSTGLEQILPIYESKAQALASLDG